MKAPRPRNEEKRLEALQRYRVLDTAAEQSYDDITTLAAHICGTPVACVSLVDGDRQWFKSKLGMALSETSRDVAFCAHTILGNEILEVPDAGKDERFAGTLLTQPPHQLRFYAGVPLVTPEGFSVGALCVVDHQPRMLSPEQLAGLRVLGRQVIHLLEQRRVCAALAEALAEVNTLQRLLPICAYCKRVRDDTGYWSELEAYLSARMQADFTHGICPTCSSEHFGGMTGLNEPKSQG